MNDRPDGPIDAIINGLGRCPKCIRTAFLGAVIACGGALAATVLSLPSGMRILAWGIALALAGLYVSHLLAFSIRRVTAQPKGLRVQNNSAMTPPGLSRREAFSSLAKAFGAIAIATALPAARTHANPATDCVDCDIKCGNTYNRCLITCKRTSKSDSDYTDCTNACGEDQTLCNNECGC
jgi:hypothetical protein